MTIETKFNCGDKVWVAYGWPGSPMPVTIGQVRFQITDSNGINGGSVESDAPDIQFDNFKAQKSRLEQYMCEETGIGSGSVWTLGQNIFATKEECEASILKERQRP